VKLTRNQVASRNDKAVRFVREVLDNADRADEIEGEFLDDYATRRRIQLLNPRTRKMAIAKRVQSRQELQDRIHELEEENETLQDQLDQITDIVDPMEEGEEGEEEGE
jgi:hypothetical protein